MIPPYKKLNVIRILIAIMSLVIIFSIFIIRENINSADSISTNTEYLIKTHITDLKKIADIEKLISNLVINLHRYYSNIDNQHYQLNLEQIKSIRQFISENSYLFENEIRESILDNLNQFEGHEMEFEYEMSNSDRDWDKLRQHLYDSQKNSNEITELLNITSNTIRKNAQITSENTLVQIASLNKLQIIFILIMSIVLTYIIFIIYGRVKDQEKLHQLAYFDLDSGLPNKINFEQKSIESKSTNNITNQVLFIIKLDRYKLITGRFGYLIGEKLIQEVSYWLKKKVEEDNIFEIYKFSTSSWLIHASNDLDNKFISEFANQLLDISNSKMLIDEIEIICNFSIGIAIDSNKKGNVELIRDADAALNISIYQGGNNFNIYTEQMGKTINEYVDIEHALRNAINKNEFSLYFQPKIDANTSEISGAEVLLRWSLNGEPIAPNIFIPIAEKSGLIKRIGNWVLEEACKQWVTWQRQGLEPIKMAVNISAAQFNDPDFPKFIRSIITRTRMPAYMLELEITEEVAALNPEQIITILKNLKHVGVSIAIDDFGTGYSSLSYLKRFPLDVLKIDQSFIRDMLTSKVDKDIVKLIIDLSKKLDYKIVAEGVETEDQYQQLKIWSCDYMQGYLFSKPVNSIKFEEILKQNSEMQ